VKTILKVVVVLPGVLFVVMGVRWLVAPTGIASDLGFGLADGVGRSSQIGDFGAFFLTAGACILIGVVSGKRAWFYPPAMLLLIAAIGRVLAWVLHDAAFAGGMILFELAVGLLLLAGARWLGEPSAQNKEPSAQNKEPSALDREPSAQNKEPSALGKEPSA